MNHQNNVSRIHADAQDFGFSPLAAFEQSETQWLSRGRIPLGALTILAGDGGLGKTTYCTFLAGAVSQGKVSGDTAGIPRDILFVSVEDSVESTILPRMAAVTADPNRVHVLHKRNGIQTSLVIPDGIPQLREVCEQWRPALIVLDPIVALFPPNINVDRNQDIRRALVPLVQLAEDFNLAVVAINHLTKGDSLDILKRISGSGGMVAAARSVLFFGRDPANPLGDTRILSHEKCNVGQLAETQKFEIIQDGPASKLMLDGTSAFNAMDSLDLGSSPQEVEKRQLAVKFLREELEMESSVSANDIKRSAATLGLTDRELTFARKETGATFFKEVPSGKWMLQMPEESLD